MGIRTKLQIHLDTTDKLTSSIAERARKQYPDVVIFHNSFSDSSKSRNFLIDKTTTKYCLFVDADDLFSENFIGLAVSTAEAFGKPCIVSVANIFKFGSVLDPIVYLPGSTVEHPEAKTALFETNLYISQNLVSTAIYKECRYEPNSKLYGFEDWHWNTKVVEQGYEFLIAPGTAFFYRQKPGDRSLLNLHANSKTVIRPTKLFSPKVFEQLPHAEYIETDEVQNTRHIKSVGKSIVLKIVSRESMLYRYLGNTYRVTQQAFAPLLHIIRNGFHKTPPLRQGDLQPYEASTKEIKNWNKINLIEPIIRFDKKVVKSLKVYEYRYEHRLATAYRKICEQQGEQGIDDLIFVPWIKKGGADLAIIDMAKMLAGNGRKVLVVTTRTEQSEWGSELEAIKGVKFIERCDSFMRNLDDASMMMLFIRIIQNWNIQTLTIMNSSIGYGLIDMYGKIVKEHNVKVVCHNYALPEVDGLLIEAFPEMTDSLQHIDAMVVDSNFHKNEIQDIYGLPDSLVHKVPLIASEGLIVKKSKPTKKVLFANRIAREKQPILAVRAVERLKNKGIFMDMYGTLDEAYTKVVKFDEVVKSAENVAFKGAFNGTVSLDFDKYDICLFTSLYEGIPRMAIDAVKAGLFIICPNVGGLSEIVRDGQNGFLLPKNANAEQYADAIDNYYRSPQLHDMDSRMKCSDDVIEGHSQNAYNSMITKIYNLKG